MNYTDSPNSPQLGNKSLHSDDQPIPTIWSAKDANMVIWSLMEIVKKAGISPKTFNAQDPSTYEVLLKSLEAIFSSSQAQSDVFRKWGSLFYQKPTKTGDVSISGGGFIGALTQGDNVSLQGTFTMDTRYQQSSAKSFGPYMGSGLTSQFNTFVRCADTFTLDGIINLIGLGEGSDGYRPIQFVNSHPTLQTSNLLEVTNQGRYFLGGMATYKPSLQPNDNFRVAVAPAAGVSSGTGFITGYHDLRNDVYVKEDDIFDLFLQTLNSMHTCYFSGSGYATGGASSSGGGGFVVVANTINITANSKILCDGQNGTAFADNKVQFPNTGSTIFTRNQYAGGGGCIILAAKNFNIDPTAELSVKGGQQAASLGHGRAFDGHLRLLQL